MKKIKFFALWALLLTPPLLLSGCGDDATDDPTPGKTPVLTIKDNALGVINVEAGGPDRHAELRGGRCRRGQTRRGEKR